VIGEGGLLLALHVFLQRILYVDLHG